MRVDVVGCLIVAQGRYLVLQRADGKTQSKKWAIPGGKIDTGETKLQAVIRKTQEETGFDCTEFTPVEADYVEHDFDESDQVNYTTFIVKIATEFEPTLRAVEHSDYRWMTLEQMKTNPDMIDTLTEIIERVERNER